METLTWKIHRLIYDTNSINRLKLLGFSISKRLIFLDKYNVAYFVLSRNDLKRFKYKKGDTEGLVNYALSIKNVNMACIIIEQKDDPIHPLTLKMYLNISG